MGSFQTQRQIECRDDIKTWLDVRKQRLKLDKLEYQPLVGRSFVDHVNRAFPRSESNTKCKLMAYAIHYNQIHKVTVFEKVVIMTYNRTSLVA